MRRLLRGEYYLLITSELTNRSTQKALFTCVVYTNLGYNVNTAVTFLILWTTYFHFPYTHEGGLRLNTDGIQRSYRDPHSISFCLSSIQICFSKILLFPQPLSCKRFDLIILSLKFNTKRLKTCTIYLLSLSGQI